jgi:hypothetical protein
LVDGILQLRLLFRRQVINGNIHDVANFRHLDSTRCVPPGVPKSVLTQNPHPAPSTQQAEQSWLNTRADSKACQSIFLELTKDKAVKYQGLELAGWYQTVPYLRLESHVRWHIAMRSHLSIGWKSFGSFRTKKQNIAEWMT